MLALQELLLFNPLFAKQPPAQGFSVSDPLLHALAVQHYYYESSVFHLKAASQARASCGSNSSLNASVEVRPCLDQLVSVFPSDSAV